MLSIEQTDGSAIQERFQLDFHVAPFVIEDAKPGGIAVAALDDHVGFLNALELKAHAQRGMARALIERITFPFEAAVAKRKGVFEHEISRLSIRARALGDWAVGDAAQL